MSIEFARPAHTWISIAHWAYCSRSESPAQALARSELAVGTDASVPVVIAGGVASLPVDGLAEAPASADVLTAPTVQHHD